MALRSTNQAGKKMYYTGTLLGLAFRRNPPDAKYYANHVELNALVEIEGEGAHDMTVRLTKDFDHETKMSIPLQYDARAMNMVKNALHMSWNDTMKPSDFFRELQGLCNDPDKLRLLRLRFGTYRSQKGAVYLSGMYSAAPKQKPMTASELDMFDNLDAPAPSTGSSVPADVSQNPPDDLSFPDDGPF